jgi:hypothetical protein
MKIKIYLPFIYVLSSFISIGCTYSHSADSSTSNKVEKSKSTISSWFYKPDFLGISLGESEKDVKSKIDSGNCSPMQLNKFEKEVGANAIYCKSPHKTVYEAEFYFLHSKLYWAVFFFEGNSLELTDYHSAILAKFKGKIDEKGFETVNNPSRVKSSCYVRSGNGTGCRAFQWTDESTRLVYTSNYEKAVGLVLADLKSMQQLSKETAALEAEDGKRKASSLGF